MHLQVHLDTTNEPPVTDKMKKLIELLFAVWVSNAEKQVLYDVVRCRLLSSEDLLDRFCGFYEFLNHVVELREVIFALFDFRDELLLLLELLLSPLLQLQADLMFVLDTCGRKVVFGEVIVLGEFLEKLFDRNER